jgi:hypothetical protein
LAEWGPADTHRPALEALAQNIAQGRPIDETTVAKAYFALRQRLGRPYRGQ